MFIEAPIIPSRPLGQRTQQAWNPKNLQSSHGLAANQLCQGHISLNLSELQALTWRMSQPTPAGCTAAWSVRQPVRKQWCAAQVKMLQEDGIWMRSIWLVPDRVQFAFRSVCSNNCAGTLCGYNHHFFSEHTSLALCNQTRPNNCNAYFPLAFSLITL